MSANINDLLARCALRDQKALEALYAQTSARFYGLVLKMLRDTEWANEVVQDAYIKIWNNSQRFNASKASGMTWMTTIVRNSALDRIRERKRNPLLQNEQLDEIETVMLDSETPTPDQQTDTDYELNQLMQCLKHLNQQQQKAVMMSFYHGYSHQELSEKLIVPLGTIKGWVRRGLEQLRGCLTQAA